MKKLKEGEPESLELLEISQTDEHQFFYKTDEMFYFIEEDDYPGNKIYQRLSIFKVSDFENEFEEIIKSYYFPSEGQSALDALKTAYGNRLSDTEIEQLIAEMISEQSYSVEFERFIDNYSDLNSIKELITSYLK